MAKKRQVYNLHDRDFFAKIIFEKCLRKLNLNSISMMLDIEQQTRNRFLQKIQVHLANIKFALQNIARSLLFDQCVSVICSAFLCINAYFDICELVIFVIPRAYFILKPVFEAFSV